MAHTVTAIDTKRLGAAGARSARSPALAPPAGRVAGLTLGLKLPGHRLGHRWMAGDSIDSMTSVVYLIRGPRHVSATALAQRLRWSTFERNPHALPIDAIEAAPGGRFWIATPYTGGADGLLTLGRLLAEKHEGRMDPDEARRAIQQLLMALDFAHMRGLAHGPVALDEALVDRRGRIHVELMGVEAALTGTGAVDVGAEVRSVVRVALELLTGVQPTSDDLWRKAPWLSRAWRGWLSRGLQPGAGFQSAAAALASLPSAW